MTAALLRHLADEYTFDSTPGFADLGAYHVPFDDLTGRSGVEHRLREGVLRGERIALVAASGSGKSSIVAHVLGPTAERVAPIVVPVRAVEPGGAASPVRVADEVLALLRRYAEEVSALHDDLRDEASAAAGESRRVTRTHRRSRGLTLALGWMQPALGGEVVRQTEHDERIPLREKTEILDQLLRTIAADDLQPVLVFDDADRWIGPTERTTVRGFFGDVVRWTAELSTAVVVAVHDRYLDDLSRDEVLQYLDTPVVVPRLSDPTQLVAILDRRIGLHVADTPLAGATSADVFEPGAIDRLFDVYASRVSLRHAIQLCHIALIEAVERTGAVAVGDADVAAAANAG